MVKGFITDISKDWIILETARKQSMRIPVSLLPAKAVIGDFIYEIPETGQYAIDQHITEQRQRQLRQFSDNLFD